MVNKVILLGNVGRDATAADGKLSFTLATEESWRDKAGEWQKKTTWHNVVLWSPKIAKSLSKGDLVAVEGKIETGGRGAERYYLIKASSVKTIRRATPPSSEPEPEPKGEEDGDLGSEFPWG